MFTTYVLYSIANDKIYVGYTSNLIQRFYCHNYVSNKGFTKSFRPWIVVHLEYFSFKSEAMKRELQLKSANGRFYIRNVSIPLMKEIGAIQFIPLQLGNGFLIRPPLGGRAKVRVRQLADYILTRVKTLKNLIIINS